MRRILIFLIIAFLLLTSFRAVQAQAAVEVKNVDVEYTYGEKITFSASLESKTPILTAYLLFQVEGDSNTHTEPLKIAENGKTTYVHFIQNGLIRPFARVFYWYHLIFTNNTTFDSSHYSFNYIDNRFPWQMLSNSSVTLHWVAGDLSFGQAAFDAANAGFQAIQSLIPIPAGEPIAVYIYASAADLQDALNLGGYAWVGGHASPDIGVVFVSITPGETQAIEMERQIPHEMAHVLLYRLTGPAYAHVPTWLLEGVASEAERFPNANYAQALSLAAANQALLPISALCGPFPSDASGATLAYAESDSFTRYLQATYGTSSLQAAISAYADGLSCNSGAERAWNFSLSQLDQEWQQTTFGKKAVEKGNSDFLPYLIILAIILVVPAWRLLSFFIRGLYDRTKSK
jgi:hypothetical protein